MVICVAKCNETSSSVWSMNSLAEKQMASHYRLLRKVNFIYAINLLEFFKKCFSFCESQDSSVSVVINNRISSPVWDADCAALRTVKIGRGVHSVSHSMVTGAFHSKITRLHHGTDH